MSSFRSRLRRPIFFWALATLVTDLALQVISRESGVNPRLQFLLPLVLVAFFLASLVRTIRTMDELQQRITLESIAIAFILTLAFTFVTSAMQAAGIHYPASWNDIGSLMLVLWAGAYVFSARRYR